MERKSTTYFTEETTIEKDGKTVTHTQRTKTRVGREPDYVKLYLQDVTYLSDMPKSYSNILYELCKYATYANDDEGLIVIVNSYIKDTIAKTLGVTSQHIANALSKLCGGDVLEPIARGTYRLNPYLFGKGDWASIRKIRLTVNYTLEGRTFQSALEYKKRGGKYSLAKNPDSDFFEEEIPNQIAAGSVDDWNKYCSPQTPQGACPDKAANINSIAITNNGNDNSVPLPELEWMNA